MLLPPLPTSPERYSPPQTAQCRHRLLALVGLIGEIATDGVRQFRGANPWHPLRLRRNSSCLRRARASGYLSALENWVGRYNDAAYALAGVFAAMGRVRAIELNCRLNHTRPELIEVDLRSLSEGLAPPDGAWAADASSLVAGLGLARRGITTVGLGRATLQAARSDIGRLGAGRHGRQSKIPRCTQRRRERDDRRAADQLLTEAIAAVDAVGVAATELLCCAVRGASGARVEVEHQQRRLDCALAALFRDLDAVEPWADGSVAALVASALAEARHHVADLPSIFGGAFAALSEPLVRARQWAERVGADVDRERLACGATLAEPETRVTLALSQTSGLARGSAVVALGCAVIELAQFIEEAECQLARIRGTDALRDRLQIDGQGDADAAALNRAFQLYGKMRAKLQVESRDYATLARRWSTLLACQRSSEGIPPADGIRPAASAALGG